MLHISDLSLAILRERSKIRHQIISRLMWKGVDWIHLAHFRC